MDELGPPELKPSALPTPQAMGETLSKRPMPVCVESATILVWVALVKSVKQGFK